MNYVIKIFCVSIFLIPAMHGMDVNLNKQLREAAQNGNPTLVQQLIDAKADVNSRFDVNSTALMQAAFRGHQQCVEALIHANARVNDANDNGVTALMLAASAGELPCVQALISAKANVNYTRHQQHATALIYAACAKNLPCVQALIAAKACINQRDIYGSTALRLVAANNSQNSQIICEELVSALLKLPNNAQKKSIIAVLSCGTKRKKGLFKKCMVPKEITQQIARYMVEACEQVNRANFTDSVAYYEIGKIETPSMKKALLEKYNPQQSICTIQ